MNPPEPNIKGAPVNVFTRVAALLCLILLLAVAIVGPIMRPDLAWLAFVGAVKMDVSIVFLGVVLAGAGHLAALYPSASLAEYRRSATPVWP